MPDESIVKETAPSSTPTISRREFLRKSAIVVAGLLLKPREVEYGQSRIELRPSPFIGFSTREKTFDLISQETSQIKENELKTSSNKALPKLGPIIDEEEKEQQARTFLAKETQLHAIPEVYTGWTIWKELGPTPPEGQNWKNDGGRACFVSKDGKEAYYTTWFNGIHYKRKGVWLELPIVDDFGTNRHIFRPDFGNDKWVVMTADLGIGSTEETSESQMTIRECKFFSSEDGFFFQAGCFTARQEDEPPILIIGGRGVLYRIHRWNSITEESQIEPLMIPYLITEIGEKPMMIRSIVADQSDPNTFYIGGWWDYSGWEYDGPEQKIRPGAGVWKTTDGGKTWENVLPNLNVNALFDAGQGRIVAGTEGVGMWHQRIPSDKHPSLFISFENGNNQTWIPVRMQPWIWDIVTPQQAMALGPNGELIVSLWGGPVAITYEPLPAIKPNGNTFDLRCHLHSLNRLDWAAGHLSIGQDDQGRFYIFTGGKNYYDEKPFNQLREIHFDPNETGQKYKTFIAHVQS